MKPYALLLAGFAALAGTSAPVHAEMVESHVTASNGVDVRKNSDDFANKYEFIAPTIELESSKGAIVNARIAIIKNGGKSGAITVHGFIIYFGDWRNFEGAVFKGGAPAAYINTGKRVGSCRNGCSLSESFQIQLEPNLIDRFSDDGKLPIQIRAQSGDTVMLELPISYINAVNEVAN